MKKVLVLALVFAFMFSLVGVAEAKKAQAEWTFMVFLNGDNNLDSYGDMNVGQMKQIGSTDKVNIIVLQDKENAPATMFKVTKGGTTDVKAMGELDMGDYKECEKFVKYCKDTYPANHYLLDIWNHGAGWKVKGGNVTKGISYDDSSNNHITTPQLKTLCADVAKILGQPLDIMAHDACLMGMLEISAEQYKDVIAFVGSEETEPGDGYPYDLFLGPLVKKPTMEAKEYAGVMVDGYVQYYTSNSQGAGGTTTSAVDESKTPDIIAKAEALADAMVAGLKTPANKTAMKAVMTSVQKFYYKDNVDIIHLCTLMASKIDDAGIKAAANALSAAVKASVIKNGHTGTPMANAGGMAIYLPTYSMDASYTKIALGQTKWVGAIKAVNACYASGKAADIAVDQFTYNLEYPMIATQAIMAEVKHGNFENFDTLLTLNSENADKVKAELKAKMGAEILNGNEQLKNKFDQLVK